MEDLVDEKLSELSKLQHVPEDQNSGSVQISDSETDGYQTVSDTEDNTETPADSSNALNTANNLQITIPNSFKKRKRLSHSARNKIKKKEKERMLLNRLSPI